MRKYTSHLVLAVATAVFTAQVRAETVDVRLRIRQRERDQDEKTINRENLVKIQHFILRRGTRETYCNMYNNNPAYTTRNYHFYLNPDTGQANIDCDPRKSGFHTLVIAWTGNRGKEYRHVDFLNEYHTYITASHPADNVTVGQLRGSVEAALAEILAEIEDD